MGKEKRQWRRSLNMEIKVDVEENKRINGEGVKGREMM